MIKVGSLVQIRKASKVHSEIEGKIGKVESIHDDIALVRLDHMRIDCELADLEEIEEQAS